MMKAVSAEFRNRLKLGVVNVEEEMPALVEELEIEEFPRFVMIMTNGEKDVYDGQTKYKALRKYLNLYASETEVEEVEQVEEEEEEVEEEPAKKGPLYVEATEFTFEDEVSNTE